MYAIKPAHAFLKNNMSIEAKPEIKPEQEKLTKLMQELMTECTNLTIKVASCKCEKKEQCKVYKIAKRIAEIIDEINELRPR